MVQVFVLVSVVAALLALARLGMELLTRPDVGGHASASPPAFIARYVAPPLLGGSGARRARLAASRL